ncbi:MAG: hypothetical protein ABSC49_00625 [Candidatus Microgenomates bacterium]|jgi:hypothetical protein
MSTEEIKERLRQQDQERLQAEENRRVTEENARREREEQLRLAKEAAEKRIQFVINQTEKVLTESKAIDELRQIDKDLLEGNVGNHDLNYSPENGKISLAWGTGYHSKSDGGFSGSGDYSFSVIEVGVNPDKETLTVIGARVFGTFSLHDNRKIEKAIDDAYLEPQRHSHEASSSSGSGYGCCCETCCS